MPDDWRTLLALVFVFAPLSLLSIGGGASLLAEIEHQAVGVHHWTTQRQFADLFAISRAAPGPGTMLSALIGWKVAGWAGALTATVALYLPSSLLVYGAARMWGRWRGSPWHAAIERGPGADRRRAGAGRRARCLAGVRRPRGVGSGARGDGRAVALAAAQSADFVRHQRRVVRSRRRCRPDVIFSAARQRNGRSSGRMRRCPNI